MSKAKAVPLQTAGDFTCWFIHHAQGMGTVPTDACFYALDHHVRMLAEQAFDISQEAKDLVQEQDRIVAMYGLDAYPSNWGIGSCPPEIAEAERQWKAAHDAHFLRILRHYGENYMADLFENDSEAYQKRLDAGRRWWESDLQAESELTARIIDGMAAQHRMRSDFTKVDDAE